ncbi:MAG TPA: GNAT family N-acetyltransferase [Chitinophagaceae bacterium]|nr:GNAT family N-acetyltransferase [Chitinophagaceae bacterium]
MNLYIRPATITDLPVLRTLGIRTFRDTYAPYNDPQDMRNYLQESFAEDQLTAEFEDPDTRFFLILADKIPAGYTRLRWGGPPTDPEAPSMLEIVRFYSAQEFHGHGVGQALMEFCLQFARDHGARALWLDVWQENKKAIRFYQKWGFQIIGTHFFILGKDVQDDYIMERKII